VLINYFSDIHLEFGKQELPENNADIVIASGDIGVGKQGVNWLKSIEKPVIYIAGNHEFYTHEYKQTLDALRNSCANSNIFFLEKNTLILDGIRFLGCTLWTDLLLAGNDMAAELGKRLNDFRNIRFKENFLNEFTFTQLHRRSNIWLEHELKNPHVGKTVVITHHAPLYLSWNERNNTLKRLAYCNNLESLFSEHDITAWFHGHVHGLNNYTTNNTRVLSNTRGYHGRKPVQGFNINQIIEL